MRSHERNIEKEWIFSFGGIDEGDGIICEHGTGKAACRSFIAKFPIV